MCVNLPEYSFSKSFREQLDVFLPTFIYSCCNTVVRYACEEARLVPVELHTAFQTRGLVLKGNL
jgi:hypothetical protein